MWPRNKIHGSVESEATTDGLTFVVSSMITSPVTDNGKNV
jgi:hypothetical protein